MTSLHECVVEAVDIFHSKRWSEKTQGNHRATGTGQIEVKILVYFTRNVSPFEILEHVTIVFVRTNISSITERYVSSIYLVC
jgi:hypothetical protein